METVILQGNLTYIQLALISITGLKCSAKFKTVMNLNINLLLSAQI